MYRSTSGEYAQIAAGSGSVSTAVSIGNAVRDSGCRVGTGFGADFNIERRHRMIVARISEDKQQSFIQGTCDGVGDVVGRLRGTGLHILPVDIHPNSTDKRVVIIYRDRNAQSILKTLKLFIFSPFCVSFEVWSPVLFMPPVTQRGRHRKNAKRKPRTTNNPLPAASLFIVRGTVTLQYDCKPNAL